MKNNAITRPQVQFIITICVIVASAMGLWATLSSDLRLVIYKVDQLDKRMEEFDNRITDLERIVK